MGEIEIKEVENLKVIGTRRTGPYSDIPKLFMELFEYAMGSGLQLKGPAIYISHENSEEEAMKAQEQGNADLEAAFPTDGDAPGTDAISCYELPGGKMASLMHKGPYDQIGPSYNKMFDWLKENELELTGNLRELYHNDPSQTPPEELLTEILAPIE